MKTTDIRTKYLDFFKAQNHAVIPRSNLVPHEDPTTLFTGSGMQPLLEYLLGAEHPEGTRLVDSQTCLRAEDIEEVGDNRHTTFFEMLGNWSLGDYFKDEQLKWFFEFLVDEVGIDPTKLYVTCFIGDKENDLPRDDKSAQLWSELFSGKDIDAKVVAIGSEEDGARLGMQEGRIFYYDASKNWWSRHGKPGDMPAGEPGGPDSEVFYLFDDVEHDPAFGELCHPNCDCGRFLEIGNSVFMQYLKQEDGSFTNLPKKNVDFGGGLERIAAAQENTPDVFQISLFKPVISEIERLSAKPYAGNEQAMRVIADHVRAAVWLGVDGVVPSNNEQGYVMRRLIRRAIRFAHELGVNSELIHPLVDVVVDQYADSFPEVEERRATVLEIMQKEEKVFRQTLRAGIKMFGKLVDNKLTGEQVFKLYDTYGFPKELSLEEAAKRGVDVEEAWEEAFRKHMQEQKERSRSATKGQFKGGLGGHSAIHKKYHTATHLLYKSLRLVLGNHVVQRGSNITDERLRFDFSHPEKMTDEQIREVESLVNKQINNDLEVSWEEVPTDTAFERGALGAFGDKYGDTVKVYQMQDPQTGEIFSYEICGGPHVGHTGELAEDGKAFKITKEQSSSAGVRRIKAKLV